MTEVEIKALERLLSRARILVKRAEQALNGKMPTAVVIHQLVVMVSGVEVVFHRELDNARSNVEKTNRKEAENQ